MIHDVAFVGVYWNDAERVEKLLRYARRWFDRIVVGVQTDDPEHDETLAVCQAHADVVVVDRVHGLPEPTFGDVLNRAERDWTLLISGDEWPDEEFLRSIPSALATADADDGVSIDGWWIHFLSTIDDIPYYSEQDNHLRLFRTKLGWPKTQHSRPPALHPDFWHVGNIRHDRSLDEMMQDYLRYYSLGQGDPGWEAHNKEMMRAACAETAKRKGWAYVKAFPWYPKVRELVAKGPGAVAFYSHVDWDGWRENSIWWTWDDSVAFYDQVWKLHPIQQHYHIGPALEYFKATKPKRVLEMGGWQGHLADQILAAYPRIKSWENYEVCRGAVAASVPVDPRYHAEVPTDFLWNCEGLADYDTFVGAHFIEHLRIDEVTLLAAMLARVGISNVYLEAPLVEEGVSWGGYGGSHIFEGGWSDVTKILAEAGYTLEHRDLHPDVRTYSAHR